MTKLQTGFFLVAACSLFAQSETGFAQWYTSPGMTTAGTTGVDPAFAANAALYGALITSNGYGYGGGGVGQVNYVSDPVSSSINAEYSGMANLIRAQGQYNQQTSKALGDYETARTQYIDNQERLANARRTVYRTMMAARAEQIEDRHAAATRADSFIAAHRPLPLGSRHLNPSTGQIHWPTALMDPGFDDMRKSLDESFESRSKSGNDPEATAATRKKIHEMKDMLHDHVLKMPLEGYSYARQFLDQLAASLDS